MEGEGQSLESLANSVCCVLVYVRLCLCFVAFVHPFSSLYPFPSLFQCSVLFHLLCVKILASNCNFVCKSVGLQQILIACIATDFLIILLSSGL